MVIPITTTDQLKPLLHAIEGAAEVCLDTEADSLHHYFEKICLLQFTIPGDSPAEALHFLVDPLAKLDLAPLFESLKQKLLILHGADYDLRMLRTDFKFVPNMIFDTMLAARLTGHPAVGLDALVTRYAEQKLDHASQKADWSQRPLPPRLLDYAVNDTRFLPSIAQNLRNELTALGRAEWHRQQCAQLIETTSVPSRRGQDNSEEAWRIKGSFSLDRCSLAILRELWKWRDAEARQWDRPSFMVCRNEQLLEWTDWARKQKEEGGRMKDESVRSKESETERGESGPRIRDPEVRRHEPGSSIHDSRSLPSSVHSSSFLLPPSFPSLPPRWRPDRKKTLGQALERALKLPETEWPEPAPRGKRPAFDAEFGVRMDRLREARDVKAKDLGLEPSLLASNATLVSIVTLHPQHLEDFRQIDRWLPWQTELLGTPFLEALIRNPDSYGQF